MIQAGLATKRGSEAGSGRGRGAALDCVAEMRVIGIKDVTVGFEAAAIRLDEIQSFVPIQMRHRLKSRLSPATP